MVAYPQPRTPRTQLALAHLRPESFLSASTVGGPERRGHGNRLTAIEPPFDRDLDHRRVTPASSALVERCCRSASLAITSGPVQPPAGRSASPAQRSDANSARREVRNAFRATVSFCLALAIVVVRPAYSAIVVRSACVCVVYTLYGWPTAAGKVCVHTKGTTR